MHAFLLYLSWSGEVSSRQMAIEARQCSAAYGPREMQQFRVNRRWIPISKVHKMHGNSECRHSQAQAHFEGELLLLPCVRLVVAPGVVNCAHGKLESGEAV